MFRVDDVLSVARPRRDSRRRISRAAALPGEARVQHGGSAEAAAGRARRFARTVFTAAGVWGLLIMTPLYFAFDAIGRAYPPPLTHADLYYGFVDVTVAWQV